MKSKVNPKGDPKWIQWIESDWLHFLNSVELFISGLKIRVWQYLHLKNFPIFRQKKLFNNTYI